MKIDQLNKQGFTLLEVMIAIVVLTVGLMGAAAMQASSIGRNAVASHMTVATNIARDQIELIQSWQFDDDGKLFEHDGTEFLDNDSVEVNRIGIVGDIATGNNLMQETNPNSDGSDTGDKVVVNGLYTTFINGKWVPDDVTGDRLGMEGEVYVVWSEGTRLRTVAMYFSKSRF